MTGTQTAVTRSTYDEMVALFASLVREHREASREVCETLEANGWEMHAVYALAALELAADSKHPRFAPIQRGLWLDPRAVFRAARRAVADVADQERAARLTLAGAR